MDNNTKSERLAIFSPLEEFAFYGFPDFDNEQRETYFKFETSEWEFIANCPSLHAKVYCALQIGYFKAKKTFFRFSLKRCPYDDFHYILSQYFC